MQCTFCGGASRARCASNHAVAPPFLRRERVDACASAARPARAHAYRRDATVSRFVLAALYNVRTSTTSFPRRVSSAPMI